ncbi:MAG: hypothetical protein Q9199_001728 [Rusavskia elegans]
MWRCCSIRLSGLRPACYQGILRLVSKRNAGLQWRHVSNAPASKKPTLPERTLLYHAGTGRTVFIGSLKLTTFFLFAYSAFLVAPAQFFHPELPIWVPLAVIIGGAIPMLVVAYATAPFVTYIHLRIPFYARRSKEDLMRFVEKVPRTTEIDLTTIGQFGWPHVYRMPLAELRKARYTLSAANVKRLLPPSSVNPNRSWWKRGLPTKFHVSVKPVGRRGPTPWQKVWDQLPNV